MTQEEIDMYYRTDQDAIEYFNKYFWAKNKEFDYWPPEKTNKILGESPRRDKEHEDKIFGGKWYSEEVLVDNIWYGLARTDLHDDVRTCGLRSIAPVFSDRVYISQATIFGARVTKEKIYVIDSLSDG